MIASCKSQSEALSVQNSTANTTSCSLWFVVSFVFLSFFLTVTSFSQELPASTEQQLENLTEASQSETEDDSYLQQLEQYRKSNVNLNEADESVLRELHILNELQIQHFISYRKLFGKLIDIYELQAVPSWDIATIRKLLPFITLSSPLSVKEDLIQRIHHGDHSLLLRFSQILQRSKGFEKPDSATKFSGSPQHIFFRYRYVYKNLIQWGLVGEKDAGEQFFKGAQNKGFDFYSFHLFARKLGLIDALVIGDFTVNMGQGLIQWQSLAFKKGGDVISIKRESPILRPYNSAGEFNFHRGVGITIKKGKVETTAFVSMRRLNANLIYDSATNEEFVSSFLVSGSNRTAGEIADKNSLRQISFGGNTRFKTSRWHIGINGIYYGFSKAINKQDAPYNYYAIYGNNWYNLGADYSYTYRNAHFFGEAAIDKNFSKAFINGVLISVDPRVDLSLLHRIIDKKYQSINGNAFTENTSPVNEKGFFAGISFRPTVSLRLDGYGDIYRFPWLKYLVDAPSDGKDFLCQLTYTPNKQVEIYTRYRSENKKANQSGEEDIAMTNRLISLPKRSWRINVSYQISPSVLLRNREEIGWYGKGESRENGFLAFFDLLYKPLRRPFSAVMRMQYFETGGYNSRLYAYENDVLYGYSIPVFYDKGYRYYLTINYDVAKKLSVWVRWAQTIYAGKTSIGSGPDEIAGNKKSEMKLQARYIF